jgi:hypothetical protein
MRYGQYYFDSFEEDRHRGEARRHAEDRARRGGQVERHSLTARLAAAIQDRLRRERSLDGYPCRLPDGRIGQIAVVQKDGDWTLVCEVA